MPYEDLAAIGAFLTGIGSVLTAIWFVKRMRKQFEADCEKRLDALREGIKIGREHEN